MCATAGPSARRPASLSVCARDVPLLRGPKGSEEAEAWQNASTPYAFMSKHMAPGNTPVKGDRQAVLSARTQCLILPSSTQLGEGDFNHPEPYTPSRHTPPIQERACTVIFFWKLSKDTPEYMRA